MEYRDYDNEEIATIVSFSIAFNCEEARRLFKDKFKKDPPPVRTLRDWKLRFLQTLNVAPRKPIGDHSQRRVSDEKRMAIVGAFGDDPCSSQTKVASQVGVAQSTVSRTLKEEGIKAFKFTSVQQLLPEDYPRRLSFCQLVVDRLEDDINFVSNICFSDEATFHLNGCVNKHNRFVYAIENPHLCVEDKMLRSPAVTCWAMVSPQFGVVFRLMDTTMNGERYHDVIKTHVLPLLNKRSNRHRMLQQDGAPPHISLAVLNTLDLYLKNRWIGRGGHIQWPPRSPDLSVLDFWLWGQIRNDLYKDPRPTTINDLKIRLTFLLENIEKASITRAYESFVKRCNICIECEGQHIEHKL